MICLLVVCGVCLNLYMYILLVNPAHAIVLIQNGGVRQTTMFWFGFVYVNLNCTIKIGTDQNVATSFFSLFRHWIRYGGRVLY